MHTGVVHAEPTERSKSGWGTRAVEKAASKEKERTLREYIALQQFGF